MIVNLLCYDDIYLFIFIVFFFCTEFWRENADFALVVRVEVGSLKEGSNHSCHKSYG